MVSVPSLRARWRGENTAQTLYEATGSGSVPCDFTYKSRRPSLPSPVLGDTLRKRRRDVTGFCRTFIPPMLLFPTRANIRQASLPRVSCGQQSLGFGASWQEPQEPPKRTVVG